MHSFTYKLMTESVVKIEFAVSTFFIVALKIQFGEKKLLNIKGYLGLLSVGFILYYSCN